MTSGNLFETLGLVPAMGRIYSAAESNPETQPQVAVISDGFWRRRLGADPNAVGRRLLLNDLSYTIVGVPPRDYRSVMGLGIVPEINVPVSAAAIPQLHSRDRLYFGKMIGRMPDGASREQVRAALMAQQRRLQQAFPLTAKDLENLTHLEALGGIERMLDSPEPGRAFLMFYALLSVGVGLVLLIACANVSGLLLARGSARQREVAVRVALGASRKRLISQFLAEGFLLSAGGAALGLLLNFWLTRMLSQVQVPFRVPFEFSFAPNWRVFVYCLVLVGATAPLCALLPAIRSSRADLTGAMKLQRAGAERRISLRNVLVAGQVAVSTILIVTAILFARGMLVLGATNPGFDLDHTVSLDVIPVDGRYKGDQYRDFRTRLLRQLEAVPGVVATTSAVILPLNPETPTSPIRLAGTPVAESRAVNTSFAGPDYFATMKIPLASGREFDTKDQTRSPGVVIVNETFARRYFPGDDAVGKRLLLNGRGGQDIVLDIVGVAADTKVRTLGERIQPLMYRPDDSTRLIARTAGPPEAAVSSMRIALSQIDPSAAIVIKTVREFSAIALWPTRIGALMLGCFGALGLFLALIGLYGVIAYAVARRTAEIGVRMALGAPRHGVLLMILRQGLAVTSIGVTAGVGLTLLAARPLEAILPSTLSSHDPATFAIAITVLIAMGTAATLIPASRASRIDPITALRHE